MALRNIVTLGDEVLRKKCRPVGEVTERIQTLVDDMIETMHDANGVGLAAPQVGVMRRIFVVDIGEGPIVLINPEIIEMSGEQTGEEGCLSLPGKAGTVTRANYVKIKGLDREGNEQVYEGTELLARAFQHENDHLDGILYIDKATETWEYEE
ncbi:MAG: peptide deformylase [Anaerovoracaceae bacterium]|nr:peptide deformylase [Bacillota bacterium]MDD7734548.1 peptide deformylase [Bacillota bacterium]MDY5906885.1 peptide deformylase [Anaerovoracaceae bacterium]